MPRSQRDDKVSGLPDMRMQACGHRWSRFSQLQQMCLACYQNDGAGAEDDIEQRLGTQAMYLWQEGRGEL